MNYSLQDFSLIHSSVVKQKEDLNLLSNSNGFYHLLLNLVLSLQNDEIKDAITDNHYLMSTNSKPGHDRGIDAIYIDDSESISTIHFFNCKYTDDFDKTKNNFPANEIDKIISFLSSLMQNDSNLLNDVNPILALKISEIWNIFKTQNPKFIFHICSNYYKEFEKKEKERFEREINKFSNFKIEYQFMNDLVSLLTRKDKIIVNAKINAIDKNFFEKSDGDIRALIVNIDSIDLIRIVLNNEDIRNNSNGFDIEDMKKFEILEDAFEDNVRVYLKQRSKINRNIKETALSNESQRFFYYNNGITITCSNFTYMKGTRSPMVELKNLQIVNGSQTIHALHEAFLTDSDKFENNDILCRIYETQNIALCTNIAEYTNSQNPVKSRDVRSIDFTQKKLEKEFLNKGLYYERKKNQFAGKPISKRIDAEKVGQVLLAFYNHMPAEAKNKKSLIFSDKYDDVFDDSINTDKILLPYELYNYIEKEKEKLKKLHINNLKELEKISFLLYSSYYLLYIISKLGDLKSFKEEYSELSQYILLYDNAVKIVKHIFKDEQKLLKSNYSHDYFFKSNKPKKRFEDLIDSGDFKKIIKI